MIVFQADTPRILDCACSRAELLLGSAQKKAVGREIMAHCTKCGASLAENASFCAACGAPQSGAASSTSASSPVTQTGMAENVAGLLCYLFGWVTGLIFYFIDKRPYVRFHAAQSIVVFGGLHIISIILGMFFGISLITGGVAGFSMGWALFRLVDLIGLILWILL